MHYIRVKRYPQPSATTYTASRVVSIERIEAVNDYIAAKRRAGYAVYTSRANSNILALVADEESASHMVTHGFVFSEAANLLDSAIRENRTTETEADAPTIRETQTVEPKPQSETSLYMTSGALSLFDALPSHAKAAFVAAMQSADVQRVTKKVIEEWIENPV